MWPGAGLELLDKNEELALFVRYQAGERGLEDRLVRSQLRLVVFLARKYQVAAQDLEDLVQQGAMGVVEAVRHFDSERGLRLSSYAAWWIRAYQLRYLMGNHRLVRLGSTRGQRRIFWGLGRERRRLREAGLEDSSDTLAAAFGVTKAEIEETAARMDARELTIDAAPDGKGRSLGARLASAEPSAESTAELAELVGLVREEVRRLRGQLGARDQTLLDERFCEEARSLADLGKQFGVSRERARQLEARVLGQLRTRVEERLSA
ncbi:MAG: sigma-70 family RNA polymerase sigma factor [Polyangia bacterium]